jgi:hypothetical protein
MLSAQHEKTPGRAVTLRQQGKRFGADSVDGH